MTIRISMPVLAIGYVAIFQMCDEDIPSIPTLIFDRAFLKRYIGHECVICEKAMTTDKNILYKVKFPNGPIVWASRMMLI